MPGLAALAIMAVLTVLFVRFQTAPDAVGPVASVESPAVADPTDSDWISYRHDLTGQRYARLRKSTNAMPAS